MRRSVGEGMILQIMRRMSSMPMPLLAEHMTCKKQRTRSGERAVARHASCVALKRYLRPSTLDIGWICKEAQGCGGCVHGARLA